jgi:hypothetical protein
VIHSDQSVIVDHVGKRAAGLERRPFSFSPGDICLVHFWALCDGDMELFQIHQDSCSDCAGVKFNR